jgi:hypothetical protein
LLSLQGFPPFLKRAAQKIGKPHVLKFFNTWGLLFSKQCQKQPGRSAKKLPPGAVYPLRPPCGEIIHHYC